MVFKGYYVKGNVELMLSIKHSMMIFLKSQITVHQSNSKKKLMQNNEKNVLVILKKNLQRYLLCMCILLILKLLNERKTDFFSCNRNNGGNVPYLLCHKKCI
jgi:hypothetical protein